MGVVGSLPVPENVDIQNGHSLSSSNENNNKTMPVIPDIVNNNHTNVCSHHKLYESMSHDRLCIKKHQLVPRTGRCSKHHHKGVIKHALRYKKHRQTTRILNSTHDNIKEELKKQVRRLELKQNNLLLQVEKLRLYKKQLEVICQQIRSNYKFIE
jgi:hypothetical protein